MFALFALSLPAHAAPHRHAFPAAPVHGLGSHPVPPGYLGIDVRGLSEEEVQQQHLRDNRGAVIVRVDHDGPAGKMGLRERDIILQLNSVLIEGEEQLRRMLRDLAPGRSVQMVVSREGQVMTMKTEMADRIEVDRQAWAQHLSAPAAALPAGLASQDAPAEAPVVPPRYYHSFLGSLLTSPTYTGAALERMSPQLAQFFGVPSNAGLLVRSVAPNSPAEMSGMHAGDVILRADSHGVLSMADWARIVKESKGRPIHVVVLRDRAEHSLTLIPDIKRHACLERPPEPLAEANHPPL